MVEHLSRNFRSLLREFEGSSSCPLCAVIKRREAEESERLRAKSYLASAPCGPHLEIMLEDKASPALRARRTRDTLDAVLRGKPGCELCLELCMIEARLARSIRRLDGKMRFTKAFESVSALCRKHAKLVGGEDLAPDFTQVQRTKIAHLRDDLAQAALRNSEVTESLISSALAYLGRPVSHESLSEEQEPPRCGEEETLELERWDEARHFKRLDALESETASLRYRNAVLSEENRRLRLAHAAAEAIRHDLERDRAEMLAAQREAGSITLKSSNRH